MFGSEDDDLTPPPSSPQFSAARLPTPEPSSRPSSPLSSPPPSPRLAPMSPSKRRADVPPSPVSVGYRSPQKKRTLHASFNINTGVRASPGSGNLFPNKAMLDGDWEDVVTVLPPRDCEVFGSPLRAKIGRGVVLKPRESVDKENIKPSMPTVIAARPKPVKAATKTGSGDRPKRAVVLRRAEVTT